VGNAFTGVANETGAAMTIRLLAIAGLAALSVAASAADGWAFAPADDAFDAAAGFDLRSLNEKEAGEHGFVKRSADGNDFARGDGQPLRFWAMNIGTGTEKDADAAHEARFLAKRGVNLVRIFLALQPDLAKHPDAKPEDVNHQQVEVCWRTVAAMKKEGIYSLISPYWPTNAIPDSWGVTGNKTAFGTLFTDPTIQRGYRAWLKALLTEKMPTGKKLADEPAVACIQIVNEDSLLFWSMIGMIDAKSGGKVRDELRGLFAAFAKKKYGDLAKADAAWGGEKAAGDEPDKNLLGFYQVWECTTNPGGKKGKRVADQLEFFTKTLRDFYESTEKYLRQDLGCKQLINASNWRTADFKQFDLERWSYGATDVMAVNRYIGGVHLGADAGWAIDPGDHYTSISCTTAPDNFAISVKQPVGHPFVVTESSWTMPNLYQSEGPLMIAAYSALGGVDGYCWFTSGSREWDVAQWPWGKMYKWSGNVPMQTGQFPAAALMYRSGYLKAGAAAVHEERAYDDMWNEAMPIIAEEAGYDPNRDSAIPQKSAVKTTVDPLAYLVGRVEVVYGGDPAKSTVVDLAKYIDKDKKTVTSLTGEERLDYGRGLCTVDSPKAQGAGGFLGKCGEVALGDCTISCANPYATVLVVSLDGEPLKTSKKVLVQVGTTCRPTGWQEHEDEFEVDGNTHRREKGFTVDSIGNNPWRVESASGTLTIRNAGLKSVSALDPNGMPAGKGEGAAKDGVFTMTLPAQALYALVTAE
jgi:hypothetical protein